MLHAVYVCKPAIPRNLVVIISSYVHVTGGIVYGQNLA